MPPTPPHRPGMVRRLEFGGQEFGLGGPGWLPTQGSHRPGRARLTHPVPLAMDSLPNNGIRSAIRWRYVDIDPERQCIRDVSFQRDHDQTSRFPPRGPSGFPFPRFDGTIKTLRLPVIHPAALRCLRLAVPSLARSLRSLRHGVRRRGPGAFAQRSGYPIRIQVETTGPPTFLGNPLVPVPCSTTPAGSTRQALTTRRRGPRIVPRRGLPRAMYLSRLNHTASALAVYASQDGLLRHHARLASGCRPALPGGFGYPQGSNERFQNATLPWQSSSFPKLSWRKGHTL